MSRLHISEEEFSFSKNEESKECDDEPIKDKCRFEDVYKVSWDVVIGHGCLGNICRGTHIRNGTEVVVTTLSTKTDFKGFSNLARSRLKLLQERWPNVIQILGAYRMVSEGVMKIIYVLRLDGVKDIEEIFASVAPQAYLAEEGDTGVDCLASLTEDKLHGIAEGGEDEKKQEKGTGPDKIEKTNFGFDHGGETFQEVQKTPLLFGTKEKVVVVGSYEVYMNDVIGQGRFGIVYRGRHQSKGTEVAVKVVCGPISKLQKILIEVEELRSLQSLNHPNILRLFTAFQKTCDEEVRVMLVLELCCGGDLKNFLEKHDSLSEAQVRRVMKQLVDFLSVMKKQHTMHRDLKPANILLTSPNIDEAVVKVADWGMAKRGGTSTSAVTPGSCPANCRSGNGMFESAVGTVAYMSPERLANDFYDFQAEVWALGVIMYEMIFARHPYLHSFSTVRTPEQLLSAIKRAQEVELAAKALSYTRADRQVDMVTGQQVQLQQQEQQRTGVSPLSPECYDLVRCMLEPDPVTRCTIEQVEIHPWFFCKETLYANEEVKAVEILVEEAAPAETRKDTCSTAAAAAGGTTVIAQQFFSAEDYVVGGVAIRSRNDLWTGPQRQQVICQALRQYIFVLRYYVIEEEVDPGRGLVLLSYAWDIYRAAIRILWSEDRTSDELIPGLDAQTTATPSSAWAAFRLLLSDDIRQIETYIQETAERLKRSLSLQTEKKPLGAHVINFSTASLPRVDTPNESFSQLNVKSSDSTYPSAQNLIFQRAISLVRTAASEALMISGMGDVENTTEVEEAQLLDSERHRRQRLYEQAMSILRLFLQQMVVRKQAFASFSFSTNTTDAEEGCSVQVLTVPLVQVKEEADQRTAQALLHRVENFYFCHVRAK